MLDVKQMGGYWSIRAKQCEITIEVVSSLSNRGNFIAKLHVDYSSRLELYIDNSDMWPRYYFVWEAMLIELHGWLQRNKQI